VVFDRSVNNIGQRNKMEITEFVILRVPPKNPGYEILRPNGLRMTEWIWK